jgi:hypothetical protein
MGMGSDEFRAVSRPEEAANEMTIPLPRRAAAGLLLFSLSTIKF